MNGVDIGIFVALMLGISIFGVIQSRRSGKEATSAELLIGSR